MLIAGVLCLIAAALLSASALMTLRTRGQSVHDLRWQARRSLVPTQLAAAAMMTVGALLALTAGAHALPLVVVAAAGGIGTVAVGAWQAGRRAVELADAEPAGCAGSCGTCTLSCN